jgi:hypothetical protein
MQSPQNPTSAADIFYSLPHQNSYSVYLSFPFQQLTAKKLIYTYDSFYSVGSRRRKWNKVLKKGILYKIHRLRVSENSVLRKIFGPKTAGVTGIGNKVHNEWLHNLYSSDIIRMCKLRRMRWTGYTGCMG